MTNYPSRTLKIGFFLSGLAALIYQLAWFRKISLVTGVTSEALAVTLAVFMSGLALGSFISSYSPSEKVDSTVLFGWLEILTGLCGGLSLYFLDLAGDSYLGLFITLLVPTTFMGATFPVLLRSSAVSQKNVGRVTGELYAVNTFGAAVGALIAGFLLVGFLGLFVSVLVAAALNIAVGLWVLLEERVAVGPTVVPKSSTEENFSWPPVIFLACFVSGFSTFAFETIWTRWLILILGANSAHAFSIILFAFLIGIYFGSTKIADKVDGINCGLGLLSNVFILVALSSLLSTSVIGALPFLSLPKSVAVFLSFFFILVPAALGGTIITLVGKIIYRSDANYGSDMGRLYAVNTVGCIIGAISAGFILLPGLGIRISVIAVAALSLLVGLLIHRSIKTLTTVSLFLVFAAVILTLPPVIAVKFSDPNTDILFYSEDSDSSVAVLKNKARNTTTLLVGGDVQVSTGGNELVHLKFLGHLPALFSAERERALVVGLGAGFTVASVIEQPFSRIDVVELSHSMKAASEFFNSWTGDPLSDPRVNYIRDDGRNYLRKSNALYDVITTDPIDPEDAGATNLYSKEYYELVHSRLKPGGVAAQWLAPHRAQDDYHMLVRTFQTVFPKTFLWDADFTSVVIGVRESVSVTRSELENRFAEPSVSSSFKEIAVQSLVDLLGYYIGGGRSLKDLIGAGPLNTDNFPAIEYSFLHGASSNDWGGKTRQALSAEREKGINELFLRPE